MNIEVEQIKKELNTINEIIDIEHNPIFDDVLLAPIKSIPIIGKLIDSSMKIFLDDFQKKKEQELVEVILKDKHTITSDMVNDVEFIINYNKTLESVRRLATNDKVKYFGNLIRNGYLSEHHIDNNEFEEYLYKLNNMSYREILFISDYYNYCIKHGVGEGGQLNYAEEFKEYYIRKHGFSEIEICNMFIKCTQLGFLFEYEKAVDIDKLMNKPASNFLLVANDGFCIDNSFLRFRKMILES